MVAHSLPRTKLAGVAKDEVLAENAMMMGARHAGHIKVAFDAEWGSQRPGAFKVCTRQNPNALIRDSAPFRATF